MEAGQSGVFSLTNRRVFRVSNPSIVGLDDDDNDESCEEEEEDVEKSERKRMKNLQREKRLKKEKMKLQAEKKVEKNEFHALSRLDSQIQLLKDFRVQQSEGIQVEQKNEFQDEASQVQQANDFHAKQENELQNIYIQAEIQAKQENEFQNDDIEVKQKIELHAQENLIDGFSSDESITSDIVFEEQIVETATKKKSSLVNLIEDASNDEPTTIGIACEEQIVEASRKDSFTSLIVDTSNDEIDTIDIPCEERIIAAVAKNDLSLANVTVNISNNEIIEGVEVQVDNEIMEDTKVQAGNKIHSDRKREKDSKLDTVSILILESESKKPPEQESTVKPQVMRTPTRPASRSTKPNTCRVPCKAIDTSETLMEQNKLLKLKLKSMQAKLDSWSYQVPLKKKCSSPQRMNGRANWDSRTIAGQIVSKKLPSVFKPSRKFRRSKKKSSISIKAFDYAFNDEAIYESEKSLIAQIKALESNSNYSARESKTVQEEKLDWASTELFLHLNKNDMDQVDRFILAVENPTEIKSIFHQACMELESVWTILVQKPEYRDRFRTAYMSECKTDHFANIISELTRCAQLRVKLVGVFEKIKRREFLLVALRKVLNPDSAAQSPRKVQIASDQMVEFKQLTFLIGTMLEDIETELGTPVIIYGMRYFQKMKVDLPA